MWNLYLTEEGDSKYASIRTIKDSSIKNENIKNVYYSASR